MIALADKRGGDLPFTLRVMDSVESSKMYDLIRARLKCYAGDVVMLPMAIEFVMYPQPWLAIEVKDGVPFMAAFELVRELEQSPGGETVPINQTVLVTPCGSCRSVFAPIGHGYASIFQRYFGGLPWVAPLKMRWIPGYMIVERLEEAQLCWPRIGDPDYVG